MFTQGAIGWTVWSGWSGSCLHIIAEKISFGHFLQQRLYAFHSKIFFSLVGPDLKIGDLFRNIL